jgi:hypothetical protein
MHDMTLINIFSLSAMMLGRMEMPLQMAIDQYDLVGNEVFGYPRRLHSRLGIANFIRPKYSHLRMEQTLMRVIDNGLKEELKHTEKKAQDAIFKSDERRSRTIVLAHGVSQVSHVKRTYVFRSYDHHRPSPLCNKKLNDKHRNPGNAHAEEIYKIARATSAAPRYFSKMQINDHWYLDGAMGANNPAEIALNEVMQMHEQAPKMVVSIGTGDKERKPGATGTKKMGLIKDWRDINKVLSQLATESAETATRVEEKCQEANILHWRYSPPHPMGTIKLDEWLPRDSGRDTKIKIYDQTAAYLSRPRVHKRLVQCASWLVNQRRLRAQTERWEVFARRFVYFCPEPGCHSRAFSTRDELRGHAIYEHAFISSYAIQNNSQYKYACALDRSHGEGMHIYTHQVELEKHLETFHRIKEPKLRSQRWLEAWLDEGRHTHGQAVKRRAEQEDDEETEVDQELTFDDDEMAAKLSAEIESQATRRDWMTEFGDIDFGDDKDLQSV